MKICTRCQKNKSFEEFFKRTASKDGYAYQCKECNYEQKQKHRQSEKGKILRQKESKKYREKYPERVRENHKRSMKKYRQTPKGREERYRSNLIRRASEFKVDFTMHQRLEIINRDKWKCQICKKKVHDDKINYFSPDKAHIDHIIPISKGGNSEPSNLQTLCAKCNLSKADKVLI